MTSKIHRAYCRLGGVIFWTITPMSGVIFAKLRERLSARAFSTWRRVRPSARTFSTDGRRKTDGRGKARVTEISEGGFTPSDPPTTTFQKICPPGKFFEMIETGGARPPQTPSRKKKTLASTIVDATFGRKNFPLRCCGSFSNKTSINNIFARPNGSWTFC